MDAGWFREPETRLPGIGDWEIYKPSYPSGFDGFLDTIRDAGMIPGIWFEFECVSETSALFKEHPEWLVKWEGETYPTTLDRYFLDFRKPEVIQYLDGRVIKFLRSHRIGYMKVDYNGSFHIADSENGHAGSPRINPRILPAPAQGTAGTRTRNLLFGRLPSLRGMDAHRRHGELLRLP